ncbi:MAG TPA: EpsI family protein [Steroidobacteraceae bacterium]|nr:EpsI family protein [Steroidobacteraceae bacterium]
MSKLLVPAVLIAAVGFYWPTVTSLAAQWHLGAYRHGWIVALIALGLLVRERHAIWTARIQPDLAAAVLLVAASVAWVVCLRANLQVLHQLLWPAIAVLGIATFAGRAAARACGFAIAFLYFAVPLWSALIPLLQWLAATVVGFLLRASGISVFIAGDVVQVAAGNFRIADGCSGLNYLLIALTLATLYGELLRCQWRDRLRLIALAAGLALLGNWIRIYLLVLIGVASDMQSKLVGAHAAFGWWLFAGVLVVYFIAASRLRLRYQKGVGVEPATTSGGSRSRWAVAIAGAIGFTVGPLLLARAPYAAAPVGAPAALTASVPGWDGPLPATGNWKPRFIGATREASALYRHAQDAVEIYVAHYDEQREGAELASADNSILGGLERLAVVEQRTLSAPRALNEIVLEGGARERWVLWYGYVVGNRAFASAHSQALWYGLASLRTVQASRVAAVRAACGNDCAAARANLETFWRTRWGS